MIQSKQKTILGTELKLNIHIEPIGQTTMDDYDFQVEVYCQSKQIVTLKKEDTIRIDENNYVCPIDTSELGTGTIKCRITAYIPDSDFEDGVRTEICGITTGIEIVKGI